MAGLLLIQNITKKKLFHFLELTTFIGEGPLLSFHFKLPDTFRLSGDFVYQAIQILGDIALQMNYRVSHALYLIGALYRAFMKIPHTILELNFKGVQSVQDLPV